MAKKYNINIYDVENISYFKTILLQLSKSLESEEFMQFIGNKCLLELNRISNERLDGFFETDMASSEVDKYRKNHKMTIKPKKINISNSTMADLSHVSPRTLENYPDGFSIAKAIEFGTGILGTPDSEFEWETQMNPNRNYDKGWYYEKNGKLYWSKGFGGKFIYSELVKSVEKNISSWIDEYLDSKIE